MSAKREPNSCCGEPLPGTTSCCGGQAAGFPDTPSCCDMPPVAESGPQFCFCPPDFIPGGPGAAPSLSGVRKEMRIALPAVIISLALGVTLVLADKVMEFI